MRQTGYEKDIRLWSELEMVSVGTPDTDDIYRVFDIENADNPMEADHNIWGAYALDNDTYEYLKAKGYPLTPSRDFDSVYLVEEFPFGISWDICTVSDCSIFRQYEQEDIKKAIAFQKDPKRHLIKTFEEILDMIDNPELEPGVLTNVARDYLVYELHLWCEILAYQARLVSAEKEELDLDSCYNDQFMDLEIDDYLPKPIESIIGECCQIYRNIMQDMLVLAKSHLTECLEKLRK